ncbi:MAG: DNA polymerase III subunit alpha [Oscillospiraceae bacterium]|jgi:DNA polymerase-3 subunit alpha|nr:DNA polymerase III subunit alpha [Oscillospiraceae bacterium]
MSFAHLHVHTEYSLLDGACRIKDLITRVKDLGFSSCAITDHGVMYGAVSFFNAAKDAGIKPIIGCEVYVAARTRFDMEYERDSERYHLVLLCRSEEGYRNLCALVSKAFIEGFYVKPRIDFGLLREHSAGLIALSACVSGKIPTLILRGEYDKAKAHALEMREMFGDDGFYLELQDHGLPNQRAVNAGVLRIHDETGIPLVVTNDVHYIRREDEATQDVLLAIQTGKNVDDPDRMRFDSKELFLKSEEEMRELFPHYPEACDNTQKVADLCDFEFEFGKYHLPEFTLPDDEPDAAAYLRRLCLEGLTKRYGGNASGHTERLGYELDMIAQMGFTDYFLITWDFIRYAKSIGVPVGPGRGSAAGSIVSYCLDITTVDPLRYNLYFERFLNPERVSMPDIDIDFCERRRSEVIDYVKAKYGADRVAQIVTFNTLKAKNSVRNVAKAMGLTFAEESELAREIPFGLGVKISDALKTATKLRAAYEGDERIHRVLDTAMAIEDMPKDSGTHAAGVVITKRPVMEYVPLTLSKKDNSIATQYTMTTLEELGLLKMDFLGLRNLTVLDDAERDIRKHTPDFSLAAIPDDDAETFEMLSSGKTLGVFQLESSGMTAVAVGLRPKSIEDITAIIALYRPGPMDSIPRFLECARDPSKVKYKDRLLEPILSVTYGCIVYQEQVIEIFRRLAGFTLGQADMIRRAMSKKKIKDIEREKAAFIDGDESRGIPGAVKNGVTREAAAAIYDEITDFANYAFNKAHAVCYAVISYQTAYLKVHYPQEYFAALLTSVLREPEKVAEYAQECREMKIGLLPPDVNESEAAFSVSGNDIRYGLAAARNVGSGFISEVSRERRERGAFRSLTDFVNRMTGAELNKRAVEALIKCGAMDSFGLRRSQLAAIYEGVMRDASDERRSNVEGQLDLFAFGGAEDSPEEPVPPDIPEFSRSELAEMEHDVTGLYLSGHPADEFRAAARSKGAVGIGVILAEHGREEGAARFLDGDVVTILGVVSTVRTKLTKNNKQMAYVTLDDGTGTIESLVFQNTIDKSGGYLKQNAIVTLTGKVSSRDDKPPQLLADEIAPADALFRAGEEKVPEKSDDDTLYVKLPSAADPLWRHVQLVLQMFPGKSKFVVKFADSGAAQKSQCLIADSLLSELRARLGEDSVVVRR